ncbi:chaperonin 10-like protein [Aspergillus pseudoustus]|uniref:Chaperonin 10-like protein n=1 Tax=Aspergillus pseudoustus TaxID=1810923 RepID=A0ABR4IJX8_9EURO
MSTSLGEEATARPTVTALRFYKRGDIRLDQLELPQVGHAYQSCSSLLCSLSTDITRPCGPDDVCVQVAYSGICGTDITEYLGGPMFPPQEGHPNPHTGVSLPVILGHEFSGTICDLGCNVHDLQLGQPVVISLNAPGGGFSDRTVVRAMNCIPLPPTIDLRAAALIEPLAVGRHSITASSFRAGQSALICGAGPIGLAILLLLRVMGASKIIVTEILDSRIELARRFGADAVINPLLRPSPADTRPEPVEEAVRQAAGSGGVVLNVAIHKKPLVLNLNELGMREKKLLSGICYLREGFEFVIGLLAENKPDDAQQMVTSVVPLSRAVEGAFEQLVHNRGAHIKILIRPGY